MENNIDEVALNCLLLDGVDVPTAVAASIGDTAPQPAGYSNRRVFDFGLIAGAVVWIVWQLV
jgi:hypothetical protein